MDTPRPVHDTTLAFAHLLWRTDSVREVRIPKHNKYGQTASGYFASAEDLTAAIAKWDGRASIYVSLNPVAPALMARAHNRILDKAEHTTSDNDVLCREWLLIDIDPRRPAGISSSDEERAAAWDLLGDVTTFLKDEGWPSPIIAMSGNGYYALYPVDLPNDAPSLALVKGVLLALAAKFDRDDANIDTSVFNASRILGVIGTLKMKGDDLSERPHRRSEIVQVPDTLMPVTTDQLGALAMVEPEAPERPRRTTRVGPLPSIPELLDEARIAYRVEQPDASGVHWWTIEDCPFHPGEDQFKCGLGQAPDGRYTAHCYHNRGSGKGWQDFKRELGLNRFLSGDSTGVLSPLDALPHEKRDANRPQILTNQHLRDMADQAWDALIARNSPPWLFVHGTEAAALRRGEGTPAIVHLTLPALRGHVDRAADWLRIAIQDGAPVSKPAMPPKPVIEDMMAMEKPLPEIRGVVGAPAFTRAGVLAWEVGYQSETRLFYEPVGEPISRVCLAPDETDLKNAKMLIGQEWLGDFPFTNDASRAHAIAFPLTVFAREMIGGPVPLFAFDAPAAGTGKGLLSGTATVIATGQVPPLMTETRDEDELRKRITAILSTGPSVAVFDNVLRKLNSGTLAGLLTSVIWRDRLLGKTQTLELPNRTVWVVTGNNLQMSDEIARRTVWIRQDSKRDQPWTREGFRHADLPGWVTRHRHELVWAFLVLIQNWIARGMQPSNNKPLGSFEAWSSVIGGILEAAGIQGFLANRDELYERLDQDSQTWRSFFRGWCEMHGNGAVKTSEVLALALEYLPSLFERTRDTDRAHRTALGKALSARRDRRFGDYFLRPAGEDGHAKGALWRLEEASDAEPPADVPGQSSADVPPENWAFSDSFAEDAEHAEVISGSFARATAYAGWEEEYDEGGTSLPHPPQVPHADSESAILGAEVPAEVCPGTPGTSAGASNAWQPCRGGCGKQMPAGQACFECAVRLTSEWQERRKEAPRGDSE